MPKLRSHNAHHIEITQITSKQRDTRKLHADRRYVNKKMHGIDKLAPWEGSVAEMRERMIFLLQDVSPNRGRYTYLEECTGLSAARWQNLFLKRLYPSMDMLYAAISLKPAYKEWLIFGPHGLREGTDKEPEADRWLTFLEFQRRAKTRQERTEAEKAAAKD
jgi:hypothetical protein